MRSVAFLLPVVAYLTFASGSSAEEPYDIVIRGGRVLDGTGNPWIRADVAIRGDRIAAVGRLGDVDAGRVLNASDRYVAPGFIDMHSHSDFTLLVDGRAESKIRQGVTTEVLGESESAAPVLEADAEGLKERLGIDVDWVDLNGYFERIQGQGVSVNILSYVGSGAIRAAVVGYQNRPASDEELERMKTEVRKAMDQGAFGLSSGLIYPPNSYMMTDELIELAKEAAQRGGIYATHIRGEGETLLDALREAIAVGEGAGIPVAILHFKASGPMKGKILEAARLIEEARARGVDITADQYPYVAGQTGLGASIPSWAHEGGVDKMVERLQDSEIRERIKREMTEGSPGWYNLPKEAGTFDNIRITSVRTESNRKYEGMSVLEMARDRRVSPEDALMDLLVEEEARVGAVYFMMSEEDVKAAMKLPWVMVGSDGTAVRPDGILGRGKPHPRFYGTFPRVLGKYVREEKALTLEEAVRKMTALPAARLGISDRGLIKPGMVADLVVFDAERVIDRATFEQPHQYAEGINWVIVSGEVVLNEGTHTGAAPGKVIRGPGYREKELPRNGWLQSKMLPDEPVESSRR